MINRRLSFALATLLTVAALAHAPAVQASDIYFKFDLGSQYANGQPDGEFNVTGLRGIVIGSDTDSSTLYGLAAGLEVPLVETLPWAINLPGWTTRFETELIFGLDWEFRTNVADVTGNLFPENLYNDTKSPVSWLNTVSVDAPIYRPVARLFRPFEFLKPITFYTGVGVGLSYLEIATDGPGLTTASTTEVTFAYQILAGFSYAITSRVSMSLGYRYLNLGSPEITMTGAGLDPTNPSVFGLDLDSHGFDAGVRVKFYSVDFPASLWEQMLE